MSALSSAVFCSLGGFGACQHSSRRQAACHASKKRKGSGSGSKPRRSSSSNGGSSSSGSSGSAPDAHRLQDTIRESREQQLAAADMLAKLLQADDPAAVAKRYVSSLDEQFFWSLNAYLAMAKKEGNSDVVSQLEAAMKVAFEAKQATLRPEIQLLNRLLAAEGEAQRQQLLSAPEAAQSLISDDLYFFKLLARMLQDVKRQPEGQQRSQLMEKLEGIQRDTERRVAEVVVPEAAAAAAAASPPPSSA